MPVESRFENPDRAAPAAAAGGVAAGKNFFPLFLLAGIGGVVGLLSWWQPGAAPAATPPADGALKTRYLSVAASLIARSDGGGAEACHYLPKQKLLYCPVSFSAAERLTAALATDGWQFQPGDTTRASRPGEPLADGLAPGRDEFSLHCQSGQPTCEFRLTYRF